MRGTRCCWILPWSISRSTSVHPAYVKAIASPRTFRRVTVEISKLALCTHIYYSEFHLGQHFNFNLNSWQTSKTIKLVNYLFASIPLCIFSSVISRIVGIRQAAAYQQFPRTLHPSGVHRFTVLFSGRRRETYLCSTPAADNLPQNTYFPAGRFLAYTLIMTGVEFHHKNTAILKRIARIWLTCHANFHPQLISIFE